MGLIVVIQSVLDKFDADAARASGAPYQCLHISAAPVTDASANLLVGFAGVYLLAGDDDHRLMPYDTGIQYPLYSCKVLA